MQRMLTIGAVCAIAALHAQSSQPLFDALRQGDEAKVMSAVKAGADANSRDSGGNTLLMQAAVYGKLPLMKFLLAHGGDVNGANPRGHTALMRAMPDLDKIKLLAEHGAKIDAATADGHTAIMIASRISTATGVVRYLIQKGADIHARDKADADAVIIAAAAGAANNLKLLLDAGAGVHARGKVTKVDQPGVDQAVADRALRAVTGQSALIVAVIADCDACVRMLLDHGDNVKGHTEFGLTALHHAAYSGNVSVIRMLLDAGAPVNVADERGVTPLMMAVNSRTKSVEPVRLLLNRGADPRAKDRSGRSVADWARIGASREVAAMLPAAAHRELVKPAAVEAPTDIHGAIEKSVALLDKVAPGFFRSTGCISCHNVSIPMIALSEARRHGYAVHASSMQMMVKQTVGFFGPQRDDLLSGFCSVPGMATTGTYAAISIHNEGYAPDLLTDGIARCLMADQRADGSYPHGDQRPPLAPESGIPGTALSIRTMKIYAVPALAGQLEASVARARAYLLATRPAFGDDYPYRLLGLFWSGADQGQIDQAARELSAQQRDDGGWSQTPHRASDAYATGLALAAMSMVSPAAVSSASYRRGVDYLMRTQQVDGSWHVESRAFGFQPYFQSGFPYDHDQWISMAGTAWAAVALMPAAGSEKVARASR